MRGKDFDVVGKRCEASVQRVVDRVYIPLWAEIGATDIADEKRVARQYEPRLVAARSIHHDEAHAVRRMTGGVHDSDADIAELEKLAIFETMKLE